MNKRTPVYDTRYVVNGYEGLYSKLVDCGKETFPTFYERFIKSLRVWAIDRARSPAIHAMIEKITAKRPFPLFRHIEIETINRCNGACSFCPVNRRADTRQFKLMDRALFLSIISQLAELNYTGSLGLFSNNEPLLDERLIEFCAHAKGALPNARLIVMTNGTLLTIKKFEAILPHVDKLVIDNYDDALRLIAPVQKAYDRCRAGSDCAGKVMICIRKTNEILTNRAGQAKNRSPLRVRLNSPCSYPFTQMIVRPDGKVSLCCNDALGMMTLGDLSTERILDVWEGDAFRQTRTSLFGGRSGIALCNSCDWVEQPEAQAAA